MTHREIQGLLADSALGRSDAGRTAEIDEHLAACPPCREWLETYRLLATACATELANEHPDGAELAAWAVLGDELPTEATAHLETCAACSQELQLVGAALTAARGDLQDAAAEPRPVPGWRRPAAAAWPVAASLAFVVLAGAFLLRPRDEADRDQVISGGALSGEETISARSIHASEVEIQAGSNIVMTAGESVTLGNGFVVASGATFAAGVASRPDEWTLYSKR